MKIAHMIFSGAWAGSEAAAFAIAAHQSKYCDVTVFVKEGAFEREDYLKKLPKEVNLVLFPGYFSPLEIVNEINKILNSGCVFDILHTHLGVATYCGVKIRDVFDGIKIVAHMHIRFYVEQFKNVDGVIAVSPWQIKDIPKCYRGQSCVVRNFFNANESDRLTNKEILALRRKFHISCDDFVFGVVSRLHIEKGVDVAIRALRLIDSEAVKLIIFGEGSELNYLKSIAENDRRINFGGFVFGGSKYMDLFDCYISPSRCESFGISQIEAIARGKNVLASSTYGSLDIFSDDVNIFAVDDEYALRDLMIKAMKGGVQPKVNLDDFSEEENCRTLMKFYDSIVNSADA